MMQTVGRKVRALRRSLVILAFASVVAAAARVPADTLPASRPTFQFFQGLGTVEPQRPHPAVARIVAPEADGVSYGSGTLVDATGEYGLVLTNWHVVKDATGEISVIFPEGFKSPAQVVKLDKDWDLAALVVWKPGALPVVISNTAPQLGESLTIAGYGEGQYRSVTGQCTQYLSPERHLPSEIVELSAPARNGDSGGPIFNARGELAGVLFGANRSSTAGSHSGRLNIFLAPLMANARQYGVSADSIAESTFANTEPFSLAAATTNASAPKYSTELTPIARTQNVTTAISAGSTPTMAEFSSPSVQVDERQTQEEEPSAEPLAANATTAPFPPLPETGGKLDGPLFDGRAWLGTTPIEQVKAVLAAVGALMLLARLLPTRKAAEKKA